MRYTDKQLRNSKNILEINIESLLLLIIKLFKLLNEKDIFEIFYKKLLAKRLLLGNYYYYDYY